MADIHHPDTPRNRGDDDAPHMSPVTPADDARTIMLNRVSWGAVLAGVVVALVGPADPEHAGHRHRRGALDRRRAAATTPPPRRSRSVPVSGARSSGILASLAGGYAAGRLAGKPKESTAGWHGLTAWALTTLVMFYLLTISGRRHPRRRLPHGDERARQVAETVGSTADRSPGGRARNLSRGEGTPSPSIEQSVRGADGRQRSRGSAGRGGDSGAGGRDRQPQQAKEARERAAQAIARAQDIPVEQARTQLQQYEPRNRQAGGPGESSRRPEAADAAASAVSRGALLGAIGLMLGAVAGWFGGRMGAVEPASRPAWASGRAEVASSGLTDDRTTTIMAGPPRGKRLDRDRWELEPEAIESGAGVCRRPATRQALFHAKEPSHAPSDRS